MRGNMCADADAREQLSAAYRWFIEENDPAQKRTAGDDLIRAIFGQDAIAADSVP
jgi:hypothetical protein